MPPPSRRHREPPELALLLAGIESERRRNRSLIEKRAAVDSAAFERFVSEQATLGVLGRRLADVASVPTPFLEHLREFDRAAERHNALQQMLTIQLSSMLGESGIRTLPLKGPLLGERLYGRLSARVSADIDLLVSRRDLEATERVLEKFGYRLDEASALGTSQLHNCMVHGGDLPSVEVHWRIHWNEERFSADLLARSTFAPEGYLVPAPADELVAMLLIYARDGFAGLRLACDLAAWWDRYGQALGPEPLVQLLDDHPDLTAAISTAALVAERLVGLPAREFLPDGAAGSGSRVAMRLANWSGDGSAEQNKANTSLIDWILTPARQWPAATRRHFLLPPRRKAALTPSSGDSRWKLVTDTALHVVRLSVRYCIALVTVGYRGTWAPIPSGLSRTHSAGDGIAADAKSI
jgi:hypothetical protein